MPWFFNENLFYVFCFQYVRHLGGYNVGDPPLSIPNREVKPDCADGTAYSGRVGSRLFLYEREYCKRARLSLSF